MAKFMTVATEQLRLLFLLLVLGSAFRVLPADPANACGTDLHVRVFLAYYFLILTVLAAAMTIRLVQIQVSSAEDAYIAYAREAAAAAGAKAYDADIEAPQGVCCIEEKWLRVVVRALLLLAVVVSFAASFLAVVCIEDGFLYVSGCHADNAWYGTGSPMGVVLMLGMALLHGRAAWVAVRED